MLGCSGAPCCFFRPKTDGQPIPAGWTEDRVTAVTAASVRRSVSLMQRVAALVRRRGEVRAGAQAAAGQAVQETRGPAQAATPVSRVVPGAAPVGAPLPVALPGARAAAGEPRVARAEAVARAAFRVRSVPRARVQAAVPRATTTAAAAAESARRARMQVGSSGFCSASRRSAALPRPTSCGVTEDTAAASKSSGCFRSALGFHSSKRRRTRGRAVCRLCRCLESCAGTVDSRVQASTASAAD